jgi:hypothetical protein
MGKSGLELFSRLRLHVNLIDDCLDVLDPRNDMSVLDSFLFCMA